MFVLAATAKPDFSHAQTLSKGDNAWLLRTNFVHWVTLTADVGLEWRYQNTYAILLSGSTTPGTWTFGGGMKWGYSSFNPEVRYYLGANKQWYAGLGYQQGMANFYNPENNIGRQGNFFAIGLTGGYMLHLNKVLDLDFNLGLGYMHFDYYQRYFRAPALANLPSEGSRFYLNWTKSKDIPTVTQLGVSLVWKM